MKNIELLFNNNRSIGECKIIKGSLVYRSDAESIDGREISSIIAFVNSINRKYPHTPFNIKFCFGEIEFKDKLTYIIFECICYYLLTVRKDRVQIFSSIKTNIFTNGIRYSALRNLIIKDKSKEKFLNEFKFEISKFHYRKILQGNVNTKSNGLSIIMSEINIFLKSLDIDKECCDEISETIIELVGNAIEHTKTDCMLDIDVADEYKKEYSDGSFYGVNITVINFSDDLLGMRLKDKMKDIQIFSDSRYENLENAYSNHSQFFDDFYKEEDFYNVASFQHKISGSKDKGISGGKGLTNLIRSLESKADSNMCYVFSGYRVLYFIHEFLEFNDDYWIGFNSEKDFINHIPSKDSIRYSSVFFPGTAYNLNFVLQHKED